MTVDPWSVVLGSVATGAGLLALYVLVIRPGILDRATAAISAELLATQVGDPTIDQSLKLAAAASAVVTYRVLDRSLP